MNKFKVGDIVKVKEDSVIFKSEVEEDRKKERVVKEFDGTYYTCFIENSEFTRLYTEDEIYLVEEPVLCESTIDYKELLIESMQLLDMPIYRDEFDELSEEEIKEYFNEYYIQVIEEFAELKGMKFALRAIEGR